MFSVPGWSLGALAPKHLHAKEEADQPSKKRKRERKASTRPVATKGNGATLWRHDVEQDKNDDRRALKHETKSNKKVIVPRKDSGTLAQYDDKWISNKSTAASESTRPVKTENGKRKREMEVRATSTAQNATTENSAMHNASGKNVNTEVAVRADAQSKMTLLQATMRQKLISARFRHLNQTLYSSSSTESRALFEANPSFFGEYHTGFRQQVSTWPENPVDVYIREIQDRAKTQVKAQGRKGSRKAGSQIKVQAQPLPQTKGTCTVADLGCGDGRLATELEQAQGRLGLRILSYDLQSDNPLVTKCDIANLPLFDGSVDVAIFCLALMGTNWLEFVEEAGRILQPKGELWIAEIKSRFTRTKPPNVKQAPGKKKRAGKEECEYDQGALQDQLRREVDGQETSNEQTDISEFVKVLERRGFVLQQEHGVDLSNRMFAKLRFFKSRAGGIVKDGDKRLEQASSLYGVGVGNIHRKKQPERGEEIDEASVLKPCLYKTR